MIDLSQLALSSPVSYALAFLLPAFDAVLPLLPSESLLIALGVATAGSADPRIAVLVALFAAGAFAGDNLGYLLGRRFGPAIARLVFSGPRGARRRAWALRSLDRFGARIIVACRFIPGARTAVTVTCGLVGYRRRRFIAATAFAGVIWASYAFFIGRLGGQAFEDKPWAGLLLALALALVVSVAVEALRRARPWRWLTFARPRPAVNPTRHGRPGGNDADRGDPGPSATSAAEITAAASPGRLATARRRARYVFSTFPSRGRAARR